ncbi:uncharacterized protein C8R40DRAFT_766883 [Lentinula edodes]|uniref:uncharacterized protein n=1 Tax=Lentinula edodes TaxID=5353 RepID=UPI001E8D8D15|nr:uncharacterized protein C8R40DRAFT_766883 [Lentinula edodes]KAH7878471.1 hypothetical protein C8R40DRAFT_766883 [Lentinula edodes]
MVMEIGLVNDSIWRISVLRSQNLHQLLHRRSSNNLNGWRPLVTISVDPHLGHNHCEIHETTLGSDGQNPNSKTGLDIESPRPNTKLLFEVVHFPQAAKKKARRLNKTVLGSCVYEMGELVRLAKEQERGSNVDTSLIDEEEIWEWEWWERLLCLFTIYRELRIAEYEETRLGNSSLVELGSNTSPRLSGASLSSLSAGLGDAEGSYLSLKFSMYDKIYQRLQVEWTYIGTLLLGLAAIDAAIFAISPSSSSPSFSDVASGAKAADLASSSSLFPVDSYAREAHVR